MKWDFHAGLDTQSKSGFLYCRFGKNFLVAATELDEQFALLKNNPHYIKYCNLISEIPFVFPLN